MKGLFILFIVFITINTVFSQAPNQFKYQAVLRDASGNIIANQPKTVVVDILQGSISGTSIFTENHHAITSAHGIINLNIGAVNSTGIAAIDWANNSYFIKITVDNVEMGTSQLLSVPYALYAKTTETVNYNNITNKPNLFSGIYADLTNIPTFATIATSGSYNDLLNKPILFSGKYEDLLNIPIFAKVATSGSYNDLTDKPEIDGSNTKIIAGTNTKITGNGTTENPYVINSIVSMSQEARDTLSAIEGYMIYNTTTHKPNYYNGIEWMNLDKTSAATMEPKQDLQIGAYYYGGWAGLSYLAGDVTEPWAVNAPRALTQRMIDEFPEREPIWGWRDDAQEIMEQQIDLAANNGISHFTFCWYWSDNAAAINEEAIRNNSRNTALELFLKAKNSHRMKFSLLIANHQGNEIIGTQNWIDLGKYLMPYLKHSQYLTVDGKPLITIFSTNTSDKDGLTAMQELALKEGLPGVAIAANNFYSSGGLDYGYTHRTNYNCIPPNDTNSKKHYYEELVTFNKSCWQWNGITQKQTYIPLVMAGWDKRPWEGPDGYGNKPEECYYLNCSPQKFSNLLKDAITWMDNNPTKTTKERIIIIFAWNEFGEGGFIAPTLGDPDGKYLKAIKEIVMQQKK